MTYPRIALLCGALFSALCFSSTAAAQITFDEMAIEFSDGLGFLDVTVDPAIDENGRVVFAGDDPFGNEKLFVSDGVSVTTIPLDAGGYDDVESVQINAADHVVWTSRRTAGIAYRGAYRTNAAGTFSSILREGPVVFDPLNPPVNGRVALSPNGTVAYSTIVNGDGAIYRHNVLGVSQLLREGTGTFFNTKRLDVNDAGEVVVQMEYFDPTMGLARGLLVFDEINQTRDEIVTAVEKQGIGTQPEPNINTSGEVAFSLNADSTMRFYDPPNNASGTLVAEITLTPGVYIATPTAFGQPPIVTQVVGTSTGFDSFGSDVQINENGVVVFRAVKTAGGSGLYFGPDPVADKIIEPGDEMDGRLFSVFYMGELNDANQLVLMTSDFISTDRQVWRVNNVPEPGVSALLGAGLLGVALFGRRRESLPDRRLDLSA
ncbi:MAG: PEP-CTERM sorting domain-containing protein [Myxococcota bacterium]